ncbi:MAG TPA: hypothetical protein VGX23_27550 [Actinocrinis sp.]|nr:hypothetical protein [Actinocrinis sp.]
MTVDTAPSTRSVLSVSPRSAVVGGIGALCLLISALGPTWLTTPAVPAAHIPALSLDYSDLHKLSRSGQVPTTWIQQNFFSWIGWTLIIAMLLVVAGAALLRRRPLNLVAVGLSVVGLVLGLFAAKGALTWSQFSNELPHLQIGAYLLVGGFIVTLISGFIPERN